MQLWVGLGNPGATYAMHRHNIGFMAIDALAEIHDLPLPAKKFLGWVDELDIAPFKVKVKFGGGAAGHNGIRSITEHIGADFRRVRLGIGHPGNKDRVTGYVLGNFHKSEIDDLADLLGAVSAEADWLAKGDDVRFMNDVAMRLQQD